MSAFTAPGGCAAGMPGICTPNAASGFQLNAPVDIIFIFAGVAWICAMLIRLYGKQSRWTKLPGETSSGMLHARGALAMRAKCCVLIGSRMESAGGIIGTGEAYKAAIKTTSPKGAALADPSGIFNSSLTGGTPRAIDFKEGDEIDEAGFKALIHAAIVQNHSK